MKLDAPLKQNMTPAAAVVRLAGGATLLMRSRLMPVLSLLAVVLSLATCVRGYYLNRAADAAVACIVAGQLAKRLSATEVICVRRSIDVRPRREITA